MKLLKETVEFIKKAHSHQVTKSGEPYWTHPFEVSQILKEVFDDVSFAEEQGALLHDILEDTDYDNHALLEMGFEPDAVYMVGIVSKPKHLPYWDFIDRIITTGNVGAMKIKVADIFHNLDSKRLSKLDEHTQARLRKKYQEPQQRLLTELNNLGTYFKIKENEDD